MGNFYVKQIINIFSRCESNHKVVGGGHLIPYLRISWGSIFIYTDVVDISHITSNTLYKFYTIRIALFDTNALRIVIYHNMNN